jgi:amino acid transporter
MCAILLISGIIYLLMITYIIGSFDSAVHISEEASNAATAVPWGIVWSICIAAIFGLGIPYHFTTRSWSLSPKSLTQR